MRLALLAVALVLAGVIAVVLLRGSNDDDETLPPDAVRVADRFVADLLTGDRPDIETAIGVVQDDILAWSTFFAREGIDTLVRGGVVERDCEVPFPVFAPHERMRGDCVVYHVRGRIRARPIGPAEMNGRMRVWLIERRGAWRVAELDFTPRNGFRSTSKAFYVEGY